MIQAVHILKKGGIVIFPTDTAWGIGCRIDDEGAIKKLFSIRKRPETKAAPVLVSSIDMAQEYLNPIPKKVKKELMEKYWPGGLTIVLSCRKEKVPSLVRGQGNTLGVRLPDSHSLVSLITAVGVPLLAPSANFSGEATPFDRSEVNEELISQVDFMLGDSYTIKSRSREPSTVIDCSTDPWNILRKGEIVL